ncbi:MAG: choice-of-anchor tandem repeat GloVer-containing protein, partial [Candidatus Korobacteraceae bacterium]
PYAGLIFDEAGNLYGAASSGGPGSGGTVFELSPSDGGWNFNLLYGLPGNRDNPGPEGTLLMDSAGNLYGTTLKQGAHELGNVFKLTPSDGAWNYTSLYDFAGGTDGAYPTGVLVMDTRGNLYGTTSEGGNVTQDCQYGCGVVFEIAP